MLPERGTASWCAFLLLSLGFESRLTFLLISSLFYAQGGLMAGLVLHPSDLKLAVQHASVSARCLPLSLCFFLS
jgi:hypothetical protein